MRRQCGKEILNQREEEWYWEGVRRGIGAGEEVEVAHKKGTEEADGDQRCL